MNNDTILRVFHPIGQGAFYSERHDNFNIVYDCGEWKNSKRATKVVEESFEKTLQLIFCLFLILILTMFLKSMF